MAGIAFGQTLTGCFNKDPYYCAARCSAVGATLPDGGRLICKAGGLAWFVAPNSSQILAQWANGQYNSTSVGAKCCTSEWGTLNSLLSANVCAYVATEWFIPCVELLQNPGFICRTNWDPTPGAVYYWSSSEASATNACTVYFGPFNSGVAFNRAKCISGDRTRAFRCVTY